jgi:hypothetical protein
VNSGEVREAPLLQRDASRLSRETGLFRVTNALMPRLSASASAINKMSLAMSLGLVETHFTNFTSNSPGQRRSIVICRDVGSREVVTALFRPS